MGKNVDLLNPFFILNLSHDHSRHSSTDPVIVQLYFELISGIESLIAKVKKISRMAV